jgi:acyl-CoA thioester hydrolase
MNNLFYEFECQVKDNEIDDLNHVNNINYLNWVQLAANKHWALLTNSKFDNQYVWVVLRHEIDYISPAFLNEIITIKTWIGDSYGVKSDRFVEVHRNNELLTKAKTTWCLLDKKLMKPVRIPKEILQLLEEMKL